MNNVALPASEIFDVVWTPEQLHTVAAESLRVQEHVAYRDALATLAYHASKREYDRIRCLVSGVMGGLAGTHHITAALQAAHLAVVVPGVLSARQVELLTMPLAAALAPEARLRMAA